MNCKSRLFCGHLSVPAPSLAILLLALPSLGTASEGFRLAGVLECTFFTSDGSVFRNQRLPFEMKVAGKIWHLTNWEEHTNLDGQTNQWIRGSDGTSIYHVFRTDSTIPVDVAIVETGPMPLGGYPSAVIWLAFA